MSLTVVVYRETQCWPQDERFGLINQIRRATNSVPLNIAEGAGSSSNKEFHRFVQIALRSTYEVMTAVEIALGLEYLSEERAGELLLETDEIAAMLVGLMKSLKQSKQ